MDDQESFQFLCARIDAHHVQEARRALDTHFQGKILPQNENRMVAHIFNREKDWPSECKALLETVKVTSFGFSSLPELIKPGRLQSRLPRTFHPPKSFMEPRS